ncbi:ABC-F family ATP-binding cassette domain-containing protein [Spiroplasma platyhelix]|uniref:ABC-F family ATP-binding cassette domain-containing protein n=1 Tax=Spiroplasma platyhelix PALS-1 TaxID=1276218 RepID=A0A846TWY3_9MOLU|nr:ABC-F family ATP-binding cassette domain-containing protein [Spiroplasma platyhelix]MBE4704188.1 putative ABC transporter ATP-binding protein YheS [Spiroplasma platyhelix PALS-1]NKE38561.1 ABC-F family ATP-binding cassette domain-containing protein [Spiroplasma platyhelix PALS-1]UJB28772.1 ABC transporter ATP-binding protein [Spiroplasma platyhelix PALS-1]
MSLLIIENLSYQTSSKKIYQNANLRINKGEHIVLIGPNGSGKTTLLNIINQDITPDQGTVTFFPNIKVGYLDQHLVVDDYLTVNQYLKTNYQDLFDKEAKMNDLYQAMAEDYQEKLLDQALKIQHELDVKGFNTINKTINNLITGLNIDKTLLDKNLASISGGQKSKILLAKLLLSNYDLLLLDEPTNFLDIEQINWLASFLQSYQQAFIVVSHDQKFVNQIARIIYEIDNLIFNRYVGDFENYLSLKDTNKKQYEKQYKVQQQQIKHMKEFIAKNSAKASKAKSAQSRVKQLEKMDVMAKPQAPQIPPNFHFQTKKAPSNIIVSSNNLVIGYQNPLIKPLSFTIKAGEKWLVKGGNGVGKTTLLQTIMNFIRPLSGQITIADNLSIGYFQQIITLKNLTPIQFLQEVNDKLTDQEIRSLLASFAIKGGLMFQSIKNLSGGEQTKVQLAALSTKSYDLLIMDEPTNHLDNNAKIALNNAINNFTGAVILTTHDINFDQSWANQVLNFENISAK